MSTLCRGSACTPQAVSFPSSHHINSHLLGWSRASSLQTPRSAFPPTPWAPSGARPQLALHAAAGSVTPVAPPPARVLSYPGISGDDIRHPLDQQNTSLLRSLPGLQLLAQNLLLSPAMEQILLLENISTSVLVGPDQMPSLHAAFTEAVSILGMEPPELYVRQNPVPNAYTLAISGRKPFVVVHTSLLELLTPVTEDPREVQAVLAHELGHLRCNHGVWLTAANVLALGTVSLLPVVSNAVEESLNRWLRAAELSCDRAALLVVQDPKVVVSVLMKLAGGSATMARELNVEAFLRQARSYDEATSSPLGWFLRNAQNSALSHPLPVLRAREIDTWAASAEYKGLLARGAAAAGRAGGGGAAAARLAS